MASRYGDFWAMRAAGFTKVAHQRKPRVKWAIILALVILWAGFGVSGWLEARPPSDAVYGTLGALTMSGGYEAAAREGAWKLEIARFAGLLLTAVGLLFGFSGAVGRSIARLWMMSASGHVVVAGENPASTCARALVSREARRRGADRARARAGDGVVPAPGGRRRHRGRPHACGRAENPRAHNPAAHVVAFSDDDTENLRIEAALRALPANRRRRLAAHVAIASPLLLMEAREMRMMVERDMAAPTGRRRPSIAWSIRDPSLWTRSRRARSSPLTAPTSSILPRNRIASGSTSCSSV